MQWGAERCCRQIKADGDADKTVRERQRLLSSTPRPRYHRHTHTYVPRVMCAYRHIQHIATHNTHLLLTSCQWHAHRVTHCSHVPASCQSCTQTQPQGHLHVHLQDIYDQFSSPSFILSREKKPNTQGGTEG